MPFFSRREQNLRSGYRASPHQRSKQAEPGGAARKKDCPTLKAPITSWRRFGHRIFLRLAAGFCGSGTLFVISIWFPLDARFIFNAMLLANASKLN